MYKITSKELRNAWIRFYEERGHLNIGAVSLIGDGTTGVMFNVAGMQALMPYLLGKEHPSGKKRLCNVQGCVRTVDIESVGDPSHFTFFEMMGNWSLGDYFKKEKTQWSYDLLTKVFGMDGKEICSTVFEGNEAAPRDDETAELLKNVGILPEHIFYLPKSDNWWELEGTTGTPCGPDNEWFYPRHNKPCGPNCGPACGCGRYVEVGNDVYMQYMKTEDGYEPLANKNVDTGFGLDRMLLFLNGLTDGYKTDLFWPVIEHLMKKSGLDYDTDSDAQKAMRIVADHIRTSTMLIGDINGIVPSNVGAGYILRRLLRRAMRYTRQLGLESSVLAEISRIFIEQIYDEAYPLLVEKEAYILDEIMKEAERFDVTLATGMKEFSKCVADIRRRNELAAEKDPSAKLETEIGGKQAFRLYDTYGFPLELTEEMAAEEGLTVDSDGFNEAFREHQQISKQEGTFKGGLAERNEDTAKLHTATHLLHAALRKVLGDEVAQKGSFITSDRLRFDFSFGRKITAEELSEVERLVNEAITAAVPVVCEEMTVTEAKAKGAIGLFESKYGEIVSTYKMGDYSFEICGGPHATNTGALGLFCILSEGSASAGVRRIEATTGLNVLQVLAEQRELIEKTAAILKAGSTKDLPDKATAVMAQLKTLENEVSKIKDRQNTDALKGLENSAEVFGDLTFYHAELKDTDANALRNMVSALRDGKSGAVVLLSSVSDGKVTLCAGSSKEAVAKGFKAGNIVRAAANAIGGSGGGKDDLAMAGGKSAENIADAFEAVKVLLKG